MMIDYISIVVTEESRFSRIRVIIMGNNQFDKILGVANHW